MKKVTLIGLMITQLLILNANAEIVSSPDAKITLIQSVTSLLPSAGDVLVALDKPTPGCEQGYWLRPTEPGFKQSFSLVTAAHLSGRTVRLAGFNDLLWSPGLPNAKFCLLDTISLP